MSHEIQSYVYNSAEGAGWHGLGTPIDPAIANDPAKIAEACGAAYRVYKAPAMFVDSNGKAQTVPNREAVVREDTQEALEVLSGNKYNIVQPVEYFEAFRDALAANHLVISSAGVLKGGRTVFCNAKLTDAGFDVLGMDKIENYVCIGGGYDGILPSFGFVSSLRTVCNNTLSANLSDKARGGKLFRVSHAKIFNGTDIATALGLAGAELRMRADVFNKLANTKIDASTAARFFAELLDVDPADLARTDSNGKPVIATRTRNVLDALASAYSNSPGAGYQSANGTAWGALNAVTWYVDHAAATRDSYADGTDSARFASAKFGAGAALKARALKLATATAGLALAA